MNVTRHLESALSELQEEFEGDPEKLHLAVAVVFSAIFRAAGTSVVIVGGQAATHWLRADGSRDADFVTRDYQMVRDTLLRSGFRVADAPFRLVQDKTNVLIELVGEQIEIAGLIADVTSVATIRKTDISSDVVRGLMPADALVLDPGLTFLNYAEASLPHSIWFDHDDDGLLAEERAQALLALYPGPIRSDSKSCRGRVRSLTRYARTSWPGFSWTWAEQTYRQFTRGPAPARTRSARSMSATSARYAYPGSGTRSGLRTWITALPSSRSSTLRA